MKKITLILSIVVLSSCGSGTSTKVESTVVDTTTVIDATTSASSEGVVKDKVPADK